MSGVSRVAGTIADLGERLRSLVFRSREERELAEELAFHIEMETARNLREGMSPAEARRRALVAFGGVEQVRESVRDAWGTRALDSLARDVRYAFRQVARSPGFTAAVVLTLALGIGANGVVFGVLDRLLVRPPSGVVAPERLSRLYFELPRPGRAGGSPTPVTPTSYPALEALRANVPAFEAVAGVFRGGKGTFGRGADARAVNLTLVTGDFFRMLGTRPVLGRFFGPEEDRLPSGSPVAVVSWGFWRRVLGGDVSVVGRRIVLDERPFTIVGVAPRGFTGVDLEPVDVWAPVSALALKQFFPSWATSAGSLWIRAIARLRPGAARAVASAQATAAVRPVFADAHDGAEREPPRVIAASILAARGPGGMSREARTSLWVGIVAALVLLIACANVAGLLLSRAVRRRHEIAVRLALGVGRGRLVRQLLTETLVLAALAGGIALVLTYAGGRLVRTLLLPSMALGDVPVDARVLAFMAGVTLLTVLLAGLVPALGSTRTDFTAWLKAGAREAGGRRAAGQRALLVVQTSLCVVLLVGAGLFLQSLRRLHALDVGIDLSHVLLVRPDLGRAGFDSARVQATYREALRRVRHLPGIEAVSLTKVSVPMGGISAIRLHVPGNDFPPDLPGGGPYYSGVDAGFFRTLGARVRAGRAFSPAEESTGERVVVVNETVARAFWPGKSPLGACVTLGDDPACNRVVGVVQDILTFRMEGDERALLYLPLRHPVVSDRPPVAMLVRTAGDARSAASPVQRTIQGIAPDMPFVSVQPFEALVAPEFEPWRLGATMFAIFGALALLLAATGLYGVLAYLVGQRTREIGIRVALGARPVDVIGLVVGQGIGVVAAGLVIGTAAALAGGRLLAPLLYDTSPRDPQVLTAVAAALLLAAAAATLLPARRAARVDPTRALAAE